jgi:hypothetical protein
LFEIVHSSHEGLSCVQTRAPNSMSDKLISAALCPSSGNNASARIVSAFEGVVWGGNSLPSRNLTSTRRTFVSRTGTRIPWRKASSALAV